jgi:hypothetical protein
MFGFFIFDSFLFDPFLLGFFTFDYFSSRPSFLGSLLSFGENSGVRVGWEGLVHHVIDDMGKNMAQIYEM